MKMYKQIQSISKKKQKNFLLLKKTVGVLETFEVRLKEKLEMLEQDKKGADNTD